MMAIAIKNYPKIELNKDAPFFIILSSQIYLEKDSLNKKFPVSNTVESHRGFII